MNSDNIPGEDKQKSIIIRVFQPSVPIMMDFCFFPKECHQNSDDFSSTNSSQFWPAPPDHGTSSCEQLTLCDKMSGELMTNAPAICNLGVFRSGTSILMTEKACDFCSVLE